MRRFTVSFLLLLGLSQMAYSQNEHLGVWQSNGREDISYIKFDSLGFAWFIMHGIPVGGPSFLLEGNPCSLTYEVDYSKYPYRVDFTVASAETGEVVDLMKGIFIYRFEFTQMLIDMDYIGKERPTSFSDDAILLNKLPPVEPTDAQDTIPSEEAPE